MSVGDDMCNFATFRPATLTVTNFFKQVRPCLGVILMTHVTFVLSQYSPENTEIQRNNKNNS